MTSSRAGPTSLSQAAHFSAWSSVTRSPVVTVMDHTGPRKLRQRVRDRRQLNIGPGKSRHRKGLRDRISYVRQGLAPLAAGHRRTDQATSRIPLPDKVINPHKSFFL
jgi:hypothetical protein